MSISSSSFEEFKKVIFSFVHFLSTTETHFVPISTSLCRPIISMRTYWWTRVFVWVVLVSKALPGYDLYPKDCIHLITASARSILCSLPDPTPLPVRSTVSCGYIHNCEVKGTEHAPSTSCASHCHEDLQSICLGGNSSWKTLINADDPLRY